jgi:hypothetical protein
MGDSITYIKYVSPQTFVALCLAEGHWERIFNTAHLTPQQEHIMCTSCSLSPPASYPAHIFFMGDFIKHVSPAQLLALCLAEGHWERVCDATHLTPQQEHIMCTSCSLSPPALCPAHFSCAAPYRRTLGVDVLFGCPLFGLSPLASTTRNWLIDCLAEWERVCDAAHLTPQQEHSRCMSCNLSPPAFCPAHSSCAAPYRRALGVDLFFCCPFLGCPLLLVQRVIV